LSKFDKYKISQTVVNSDSSSSIPKFDKYKISGSIEKEQRPVGQLEDIAKGAMSGLSYFGRGGANLVNEYIRPAMGKAKLSQDELNKRLSIIGAQEYNPETFLGKTAKFAGEVAPTLAVKSVTVPSQTLLGATLGATEAANRGDNVVGGALMGGGIGLLGALGLKGAGKLAPILAEKMSGIPQKVYKEALSNPTFFEGDWDKNAIKRVLSELDTKFGKQVDEAARGLPGSADIPYKDVMSKMEDLISKSYQGADTSAEYRAAKSILDSAMDEHILIPALKNAGIAEDKLPEVIAAIKAGTKAVPDSESQKMFQAIKANAPEMTDEEINATLKAWGYEPAKPVVDINNLFVKPANLNQFKKEIQSKINFDSPETKLQARLLKQVQGEAAKLIEDISPEYKRANDLYSALKDSLKKDSAFKNIKNALKSANPDYEEKINNKLLTTLQNSKNADDFVKELNKLNQRGYFEQFAPHKVDIKGVGGGNTLLGMWSIPSALSGNILPLLTHLAINAGISPMAQKGIVQLNKAGIKQSPYYTRLLQQAGNFVTRPQQENK